MGVWHGGHFHNPRPQGTWKLYRARDATTFLPILLAFAIIIIHPPLSQVWPGIIGLSTTFVQPTTGTHTVLLEQKVNGWFLTRSLCVNSVFKFIVDQTEPNDAEELPSYLDEFLWWEQYGCAGMVAMLNIMRHIGEQYPLYLNLIYNSFVVILIRALKIMWHTTVQPLKIFSALHVTVMEGPTPGIIAPEGRFLREFGKYGKGKGELSSQLT